jgi:nitroreductase
MSVWQAINTVRVVRDFAERPLDPDHLDRILNAGRRTASSKNRQDWAFIVVRDREQSGHHRHTPVGRPPAAGHGDRLPSDSGRLDAAT